MRLAKELYWAYISDLGATSVGNVLIYVNGVFMNLEDTPSSYIEEEYGYTKEEFIAMLSVELDTLNLEESLNDV